ncbi:MULTISPECIES: hypothetical protein [Reichenbachiella]|uniref:Uncharacterized protein n=1 Tax=Reichenbachiella agariperforans TaxID=156994 RepID=A0A1M6LCH8_REIAG|nr:MULTISPECIES: hypothetical protein [Reichenbachiella]MBU2913875.1 hypothetical protein [Reichenbachiella agariperforans]RJE74209.1 hypothetical protein BGP76_13555 [Reichenbachiella sp. MSK19-1]SHJ68941.1 hypothetical protein SAMN04488028_101912 [Reichenbachiella agariperforans]
MDSIDVALYISYTLTILAGLAAIVFPIINSVSDPKSLVKAGAGLGALLVIFLISWAISGSDVTAAYADLSPSLSKFIGGLLTMMYVLTGLALVGIVYTEVSKAIK